MGESAGAERQTCARDSRQAGHPQQHIVLVAVDVTAAQDRVHRIVHVPGASIPDLISRLFIFLGIVGALLPNYHPFVQRLKRLSPLDDRVDDLFLHRIKLTVWSMFLGIFVLEVYETCYVRDDAPAPPEVVLATPSDVDGKVPA